MKTCEENRYNLVSTKEECELVARSLKLEDRTAHDQPDGFAGVPHGCVYAGCAWLAWDGLNPTKTDCSAPYPDSTISADCLCRGNGMNSS